VEEVELTTSQTEENVVDKTAVGEEQKPEEKRISFWDKFVNGFREFLDNAE